MKFPPLIETLQVAFRSNQKTNAQKIKEAKRKLEILHEEEKRESKFASDPSLAAAGVGNGGNQLSENEAENTIYVSKLDGSTTVKEVKRIASVYGAVSDCWKHPLGNVFGIRFKKDVDAVDAFTKLPYAAATDKQSSSDTANIMSAMQQSIPKNVQWLVARSAAGLVSSAAKVSGAPTISQSSSSLPGGNANANSNATGNVPRAAPMFVAAGEAAAASMAEKNEKNDALQAPLHRGGLGYENHPPMDTAAPSAQNIASGGDSSSRATITATTTATTTSERHCGGRLFPNLSVWSQMETRVEPWSFPGDAEDPYHSLLTGREHIKYLEFMQP